VMSLRLTSDRLQLLTRYRDALAATLGHPVSLVEAVFTALGGQAPELQRAVTR
jgi:hypothetical protein